MLKRRRTYTRRRTTVRRRYSGKKRSSGRRRATYRRNKLNRGIRPSPAMSATLFPAGRTEYGQDGDKYIVKVASNGVKRWVKCGDYC